MITEIDWSRKQMDLYEFYQSTDLSIITSKYLYEFFYTLKYIIMPWMEEICNIKLNRVSASCSMYNCGDHLLVHDDLLNDRQIAFIFYLTPWKNVECWNDKMGGCLELFDTTKDSNNLPNFPVMKKISPKNNQFVFFKVGSKSYHQVGEVTQLDYPRLTINGWFHGEENKDFQEMTNSIIRQYISLNFEKPLSSLNELSLLENYINEMYLEENIKKAIQKHIEDNSEISLQDFLHLQKYEEILNEIKSYDSIKWIIKGPANIQNYEILEKDKIEGKIDEFYKLFCSEAIFKLLYEYTDLDLFGKNAKNPTCHVEIQRWCHGSYTILGDGTSSCDENTLELIFYLNASENCGVITYLSTDNTQDHDRNHSDVDDDDDDDVDDDNKSDDSVLLTITPKSNNLSIVYRSKGTTKFTKYVSKKCKMSEDFVYIVVASYRE